MSLDSSIKILIVGKLGTRKHELACMIADAADATIVRSATTRPYNPSRPDEHLHIDTFEAEVLKDNAVAHNIINGFDYLATRREFENHNIFVIDPTGALSVMEQYPDLTFMVIYVNDPDDERRLARVGSDELCDRASLLIRDADEARSMDAFTQTLQNTPPENLTFQTIVAPYDEEAFTAAARVIAKRACALADAIVHPTTEFEPIEGPCAIEVVFAPIREGIDKNWRTVELSVPTGQSANDAIATYLAEHRLPTDYPIEDVKIIE